MTVFNAEEVKKCLEDVVGEDKEYALWLLEWAINKRSYDLEEHDKQIIEKCARTIENSKTLFENHQTETIIRTKDKCITMIRNLKEQNK